MSGAPVNPPRAATNTLLQVTDLERSYRLEGEEVHAVRNVSFSVNEGEYLAVVGPSGCGKSTLLNLLGALDRPTRGTVTLQGRSTADMNDRDATRFRLEHIGFVFQRFHLMPTLSALENVELPMAEAGASKPTPSRARELLTYMGLGHRERHRPTQLSGGEQQRVSIARALANEPMLLLADEPTGELDAKTGREIIDLFRRLNDEGTTILVVTHDEELAAAASRVIHMRDGRIVADDVRAR